MERTQCWHSVDASADSRGEFKCVTHQRRRTGGAKMDASQGWFICLLDCAVAESFVMKQTFWWYHFPSTWLVSHVCLSSNWAGYISTWSSLVYVWIFSYPRHNGPRAVKNIANWYLCGKASWKFDFGVRQFPLTASPLCKKERRKKTNIYAACYLPFLFKFSLC